MTGVTANDSRRVYDTDMIKPEALLGGASGQTTLDHPLEHLMACHRRIEERLATLERATEALDKALHFLETTGATHTEDEEESLFPRLRRRLGQEDTAFLAQLEMQHIRADALNVDIKRAAETLRARVGQFVALYREHIADEDSRLQTIAKDSLNEEDLASIATEMKQRRGNLG